MPNFRRAHQPGGTFFFTVVTFERRPLFADEHARELLRRSISECLSQQPFELTAIVLLHHHLHSIWMLPDNDADFSTRWAIIKQKFSAAWLANASDSEAATRWQRRRSIWQPRFSEHQIRDDADLHAHLDYVHFNPVKHG